MILGNTVFPTHSFASFYDAQAGKKSALSRGKRSASGYGFEDILRRAMRQSTSDM